jgi:transposase
MPPVEKGAPLQCFGTFSWRFSTKLHAVVDFLGRPLYVELTPGQQHEATLAASLITKAEGRACIADAGYDAGHIRYAIRARGMKDVIPSNPTRRTIRRYDKKLYRQRYLVEVFFHTLKSFRRIATRYEKTSRNYLAIVHLACALHWLKVAP